jgi:hypothetical protein
MPGPRRRSILISRLAGRPAGSPQAVILDELRACILDGEVPPGPDDDALARAAHAAMDDAVVRRDGRVYHRESRRFHLALIRPCRMRRLLHMLDVAWNMTEPLQPMSHLDSAGREDLHRDHAGMLTEFIERDPDALIGVFAAHHHRLQSFIGTLPRDTGLFADPEDIPFRSSE